MRATQSVRLSRRPALTTALAAAVMSVLTIAFARPAVEALSLAGDGDPASPLSGRLAEYASQTGQDASAIVSLLGAVMLVLCVLYVVLVVGVLVRRRWARDGAMVVCGFLGVVAAAPSIAGLADGADNALGGVIAGLANLAVAALLFSPPSADDVESTEHARLRTRTAHGTGRRPR